MSWFWELIDNGAVPNADWSVWDEIVPQETDDISMVRKKGVKQEDDEQSTCLKRIREFQKQEKSGILIDRSQYDRFGLDL